MHPVHPERGERANSAHSAQNIGSSKSKNERHHDSGQIDLLSLKSDLNAENNPMTPSAGSVQDLPGTSDASDADSGTTTHSSGSNMSGRAANRRRPDTYSSSR